MKRTLWCFLTSFCLLGCGPDQAEVDGVAIATCNMFSESKNEDGAFRLKEMSLARKEIGAPPYLGTDDLIKESLRLGLCEELVKEDPIFSEKLEEKRVTYAALVALKRQMEEMFLNRLLESGLKECPEEWDEYWWADRYVTSREFVEKWGREPALLMLDCLIPDMPPEEG